MLKKTTIMIIIFTFTIILSGCNLFNKSDKIQVVTTLFPQYDFVKQIGQDKVDVRLLLKPGMESHSFDLSGTDIARIDQSHLFIYTNIDMEPWVDNLLENITSETLVIKNASEGITFLESSHEPHQEESDENEDEHLHDPHVWTDPLNAIIMLDNVLDALISVDPDNQAYYEQNASHYKNEILELHNDFETLFNVTLKDEEKIIAHGGHFALGYFIHRYDIQYVSPYESLSPNGEPLFENITTVIETMKDQNMNYIYVEELVSPKVAETIMDEFAAKGLTIDLLVFHGIHNISKEELNNNETYVTLMRKNLNNLKKGFGINE